MAISWFSVDNPPQMHYELFQQQIYRLLSVIAFAWQQKEGYEDVKEI